MNIKKHLEKIRNIKREKFHPILHHIHKKHNISKRTLFYIKEYGPHTHAFNTIIKESIKILILASLISALGGIALEQIKLIFIVITPLVVLLPILNDMLGDYGSIVSSKVSTLLHEKKMTSDLKKNKELIKLLLQILLIALVTTLLSILASSIFSLISGYNLTRAIFFKIILISLIDVFAIVTLLFFIAIIAGVYLYNHEKDPSNFLIPITTSIADFGNMLILFALVILFF